MLSNRFSSLFWLSPVWDYFWFTKLSNCHALCDGQQGLRLFLIYKALKLEELDKILKSVWDYFWFTKLSNATLRSPQDLLFETISDLQSSQTKATDTGLFRCLRLFLIYKALKQGLTSEKKVMRLRLFLIYNDPMSRFSTS